MLSDGANLDFAEVTGPWQNAMWQGYWSVLPGDRRDLESMLV